ncbi:hypothetical protein BOX15_Mlig018862g2 [Macrostomum lignano]|uniref:RING-type domain-containing protein n=1 Tax=Macrostomum lignano TaxID=282301 RepID=A0A267FWS0_9PLAT|nr:hypothetical protein BOX15_Mlig018862g2 [Macrostomum lignano]
MKPKRLRRNSDLGVGASYDPPSPPPPLPPPFPPPTPPLSHPPPTTALPPQPQQQQQQQQQLRRSKRLCTRPRSPRLDVRLYCSLCAESLETGVDLASPDTCTGHTFHLACMTAWLETRSSPVCPIEACSRPFANVCVRRRPGGRVLQRLHADQSFACPICREPLAGQCASPDCCRHAFCLPCLRRWSRASDACPLDRRRFSSICLRPRVGSERLLRRVRVAPPRRQSPEPAPQPPQPPPPPLRRPRRRPRHRLHRFNRLRLRRRLHRHLRHHRRRLHSCRGCILILIIMLNSIISISYCCSIISSSSIIIRILTPRLQQWQQQQQQPPLTTATAMEIQSESALLLRQHLAAALANQ